MDEKSVADMWDSISDLHNDWESISGEERSEIIDWVNSGRDISEYGEC